jgi:TonB dependent receptor
MVIAPACTAHHGNFATGDLDDNPYTLYNKNSRYLVPGQSNIYYRKTVPSRTAGVNYEFTRNMSAYVRANDGVHLPAMTDLTAYAATPVEQIHNMEIGFKFENEWVYATLSAFRRLFYGVPVSGLQVAVGDTTEAVSYTYGSETNGLDFQGIVKPFKNFSVALSGDYQDSRYTHSSGCFTFEGATTQTVCTPSYSFDGKPLARQPDVQFRLTPAYTLPTDWGFLRGWLTYEYIGKHFGDQLEQQPLGD